MTSNSFSQLINSEDLPVNWELKRLNEVAYINQNTSNLKEFSWINYTDISSVGTNKVEQPTRLEVKDAPSRARRVLKYGDTVISSVRPNRKSFFYFKGEWENAIASTGFAVVSPKNLEDSNYLNGLLTSDLAVRFYESICEGGAYPAFNPSRFADLMVPWPSTQTRRILGTILMNLQEKTKSNETIASTLESIAQSIFKSWFIDFEPVHAKSRGEKPFGMDDETAALFPDSFEESELGMIPKGWEFENIANFAQIRFGAPFSSALFNTAGEGNPLIRIRDLKNQATNISTTEAHSKGFLAKPGDLLVGMDGEFTPVVWFGDPSLVNQRICMFEPINQVHNFYLYFNLIPVMKQIENGAAGTTVIHLSKGELDSISLLQPGSELLERFKSIVSPICLQMASVMNQNRRLSRLRDLLLPKLISGELQIPEELPVS